MLDLVALELVVERRAVDSEGGGRIPDIAPFSFHRGEDDPAFHFGQRNVGNLPALSGAAALIEPREIALHQRSVVRSHDGALDDVFQFAHIAGPVVLNEQLERAGGDARDVFSQLRGNALHKVLRQQGYVFAPFAQGWNAKSQSH